MSINRRFRKAGYRVKGNFSRSNRARVRYYRDNHRNRFYRRVRSLISM